MSSFLCSPLHTVTLALWAAREGLTDDPVACAVSLHPSRALLERIKAAAELAAKGVMAPQVWEI